MQLTIEFLQWKVCLSLLERETKADAMLRTACALLEGSLSQWDLNWWQNVVRCRHREGMTWDNVRSVPWAVRAEGSGCFKHEVTAICFLLRYPASQWCKLRCSSWCFGSSGWGFLIVNLKNTCQQGQVWRGMWINQICLLKGGAL